MVASGKNTVIRLNTLGKVLTHTHTCTHTRACAHARARTCTHTHAHTHTLGESRSQSNNLLCSHLSLSHLIPFSLPSPLLPPMVGSIDCTVDIRSILIDLRGRNWQLSLQPLREYRNQNCTLHRWTTHHSVPPAPHHSTV